MGDTTSNGGQVQMDSCRGHTGTIPTSRQAHLRTTEDPQAHQMPTASTLGLYCSHQAPPGNYGDPSATLPMLWGSVDSSLGAGGGGSSELALSREWETRGKAGRHASETPKMRVAAPSSSDREFPPVLYLSAAILPQLAQFY